MDRAERYERREDSTRAHTSNAGGKPQRRHSVGSEAKSHHGHYSEHGRSGKNADAHKNPYRDFEETIERKGKEILQGYYGKLCVATHSMSSSGI